MEDEELERQPEEHIMDSLETQRQLEVEEEILYIQLEEVEDLLFVLSSWERSLLKEQSI